MYMKAGEIEADSEDILRYVQKEVLNPEKYKNVCRPEIIRECTACKARGGCMTDLVCHTAPLENAISILKCGTLLSAVNKRKLPETILQQEERKQNYIFPTAKNTETEPAF